MFKRGDPAGHEGGICTGRLRHRLLFFLEGEGKEFRIRTFDRWTRTERRRMGACLAQ